MIQKHTAESIRQAKTRFFQVPAVCAMVLLAIHIIPKDKSDHDLRLGLTLAYLAAALVAVYYCTGPREKFMKQWYEWRFEDCGPALDQMWRLYLSSLTRAARILAYLLMVLILCAGLNVLSLWPEMSDLAMFHQVFTIGWWGSLIGLVLLPLAGAGPFSEMFQRRRVLDESLETSHWFKPRTEKDLNSAIQAVPQAPVEAIADHVFRAGGYEWDWEDFYKNAVIFGQSGTGKTVCVLNALLDGLLASANGSEYPPSGLILDPKGDFLKKIDFVCRKYGRQSDLRLIDPYRLERSIRWNPFDSSDDELEIAARFGAVLESTGMQAGGNDGFWIDSAKKFIRHAINLIRLTNENGEPPSFYQINKLAISLEEISRRADLLDDDDPRGDLALDFFSQEWFKLAENTRSSILAYITNMIDPFLMEPYNELFSGFSTERISDMLDNGRILYVYMPIADKERMARVISTFIKLEFYREVLKRPDKKRSSFFLCDEFQAFFTVMPGKGDSDFFERSRQSNHANIIATQNYPALLKQAADKESTVKNLLGNCAVKMFLRNTDETTNKYAAELFGQNLSTMLQSSISAAGGRSVGGAYSQSASRQYDYRVRMEEFIELAVPNRRSGTDYCETIVHLASRGEVSKEKLKWKVHPITS